MESMVLCYKEVLSLIVILLGIIIIIYFKKVKEYITLIKVIRFFYFLFILFAFCIFSYLLIEIFSPLDNTKEDEHSRVLYLSSLAIMTSAFLASLSAILSIMETKENIKKEHKLIEYKNLLHLNYLIESLKNDLTLLDKSIMYSNPKKIGINLTKEGNIHRIKVLFLYLESEKDKLYYRYKELANQDFQIYLPKEVNQNFLEINILLIKIIYNYDIIIANSKLNIFVNINPFFEERVISVEKIRALLKKIDTSLELKKISNKSLYV